MEHRYFLSFLSCRLRIQTTIPRTITVPMAVITRTVEVP
jgi:hypothetical protein